MPRAANLQRVVAGSLMFLSASCWLIVVLQLIRGAVGGTEWNPGWFVFALLSMAGAIWSSRSHRLQSLLSLDDPQAHRSRFLAVCGLLAFFLLLVVGLKVGSSDLPAYKRLVFGERAPIELCQVFVLGLAIRATWMVGSDLYRLCDGRWLGRTFRVGAGLLTFLLLEELAWGQVIFSWNTPQVLAEINAQNETTLHNIGWFQDRLDLATFLATLALFVLVLLAPSLIRPLSRRVSPSMSVVLRALCPGSYFWPLFAAVAGLALCVAIRPGDHLLCIRDQEWGELVLYLSVLMYLMRAHVLLGLSQKAI